MGILFKFNLMKALFQQVMNVDDPDNLFVVIHNHQ
jgi:hypothetical protein